jgi:hypothetical protein
MLTIVVSITARKEAEHSKIRAARLDRPITMSGRYQTEVTVHPYIARPHPGPRRDCIPTLRRVNRRCPVVPGHPVPTVGPSSTTVRPGRAL